MRFKMTRALVVGLLALALALILSATLTAQDDVPTVYFYNNTGFMQYDAGGSDPDALTKVQDYIIEQTGVRPEAIVPPGTGPAVTEKLNLLLGSSDPLDVFNGDWQLYREALIPLNDLLDEHGQHIREILPPETWTGCTDGEGNIWCIPRTVRTNPYITWVRADWLEAIGMEVPTTVEELEAVMAAFQEYNPDFFITTKVGWWPQSSVGGWTEYGYSNWLDESDNRVKPWILQPGVQDWVAKTAEWYAAGYLYPDAFTNWDEPEVMRTCNAGIHMAWYSRITLIVPQIESACTGMEYVRTSITGPEGYLATVAVPGSTGYVITKKAQNPAAVIQLIDWMYADVENLLTSQYGIEDEGWWWSDEAGQVIERDTSVGYKGEYSMGLTLLNEIRFRDLDPSRAMHHAYLSNELRDFSDARLPFDANVVYNTNRIAEEVPGLGDLQRLIEEQLVLFYTGARPVDQWDNFVEDLYRAGMEDWINALTAQYFEFTGS